MDAIPSLRIPGITKTSNRRQKMTKGTSLSSYDTSFGTSDSSPSTSPFRETSISDAEDNYSHLYTTISRPISPIPEEPILSFDDNYTNLSTAFDGQETAPPSESTNGTHEAKFKLLQFDDNNNCNKIVEVPNETRKHTIDAILSDLLISDKEVNVWTGIPSLVLLEEICLACRKMEDVLWPRQFKMHISDRVILVLARLKQNISFEALGTLFRISGVTVSKYFSHTIQLLARVLNRFVYLPSKEEIKNNIPLCFRQHFPNVTIVLDCTEVPVASLNCLNCRISCYSNYKSRRTVKFLVGVTPAGLISFSSTAYSGKASDKFIFNNEHLIDRLQAHVDEIMVDKGVTIENECSTKCIKLHIPPFMRGERLTASEASRNESIARARIHVERVIQRIKIFEVWNGTIHACILGHIDDIMITICGIVNLSQPVLSDDKF